MNQHEEPLVTFIIAVYNGENHLAECIESILNQTYQRKELVIIDGGSTDSTVSIIQSFGIKIDFWLSEKDNGISDAFNKGLSHANGDYINFQGDGDGLLEPNILQEIMEVVEGDFCDLIACNVVRVSDAGEPIYTTKLPSKFRKSSLLKRMSLPHQGLLTHRRFFEQFGNFEVSNRYCMDYELLLKAYQEFPRVKVVKQALAQWRADGLGNGKTEIILKEYHRIRIANNVAPNMLLKISYFWSVTKFRLKQLIFNGK